MGGMRYDAVLLGANWDNGANSGSRAANWNNSPSNSNSNIGARGLSDDNSTSADPATANRGDLCGQPHASSFGEYTTRFAIAGSSETSKPARDIPGPQPGKDLRLARRHRNLIERILDPENFSQAYQRAARGRRGSAGYLTFKEHDAAWLALLRQRIETQTYRPGPPREFWVYEPKPRPITALPFRDRVVQHALVAIIGPIFEAGMLPQSYGCRPGRGVHSGAIKTQAMMRQLTKSGRPVYALKTDFSKYFYSIDRAALWRRIEAKISCRHTLWLIEQFTPRTGRGLPIGNLTSQLWANVYGTAVDRFIAQTLRISTFVRYMDDVVILHNSRAVLEGVRDYLEWFCLNSLRLEFSRWSIQSTERGVNFLGYRIFLNQKLLRRNSVINAKRRIRTLTRARDKGALKRFLAAWLGHARWADSHNLIRHLAKLKRETALEHHRTDR